jgi:molecular chaperone GrpE
VADDPSSSDPLAGGNGRDPDEPSEGRRSSRPAPEPTGGEQAEEQELDPLEAAQAEVARVRDQLLRTAADFDNFRKRSRREVADAEVRGAEGLLKELLPIFDNLERAASHAESATDVQSLVDGIRMVMRQFHDTLSRVGIERVDAEGAAFDPAVMEAIQHFETSSHPPGTVTNQVQAGYRMGDRLIRPAMVVVAKAPSAS